MASMSSTTTGQDICDQVAMDKFELDPFRLAGLTTDGAPLMTGKINGFTKKFLDAIGSPEVVRMLEVIRNETGRQIDRNYGMFVLVIMSHGSETAISGSDGTVVQRTDINNALSAQNFPAMARKPKLVIIQACSRGLPDEVVPDPQPATPSPHPGSSLASVFSLPTNEVPFCSATTLPTAARPITSSVLLHPPGSHEVLDTDDLLIWEASFRGHMAYRHHTDGSWFITAVVESLSKHACHRDLKTLFDKQIKKKVRKRSMQFGGQQPTMTETLQKDLFLFPGYNPPDPE
ncbi:cell death protein 3-like [Watersipora subatra]|uniref:cell death protein 3-like n=1 Tax=Watersipora subatra TaxID=2589382 RepID=UPI00355C2545